MGATEREALDRLVREFGAEVEDPVRRRSHPPARQGVAVPPQDRLRHGVRRLVQPLPRRAARRRGVERRLSRGALRRCWRSSAATFDTYWNDTSFEPYDPDRDRDRLDDALAEAAGRRPHDRVTISTVRAGGPPLPLPAGNARRLDSRARRPRSPPQPRRRGDGTGKTVIAALDYRRLC